jgi:hypothetical protein
LARTVGGGVAKAAQSVVLEYAPGPTNRSC